MSLVIYSRLILLLPILVTVDLVAPHASLAVDLANQDVSLASRLSLAMSRTSSDPISIRGKDFSPSDPFVIENLEVKSGEGPGIMIEDCSYIVIRGNSISECQGSGIFVKDSENIVVEGNILESNEGGGIIFERSVDSEISDNQIAGVGGSSWIRVSGVEDVKILDNKLAGLDSEDRGGVDKPDYSILIEGYEPSRSSDLIETKRVLVSGNRLEGSSVTCISVVSSMDVEIRDNSLDGDSQYGVRMSYVEEVMVHHNQIYDMSEYGIWLESVVHDCKIYENTVSGSSSAGICIEDSYDNSVYRNKVVQKSGNAIILSCSITESGDESTRRTTGNVIFENDISIPSGTEAIVVEENCTDNQISNNKISEI
jgi:parallel beta-helix repeat protein